MNETLYSPFLRNAHNQEIETETILNLKIFKKFHSILFFFFLTYFYTFILRKIVPPYMYPIKMNERIR